MTKKIKPAAPPFHGSVLDDVPMEFEDIDDRRDKLIVPKPITVKVPKKSNKVLTSPKHKRILKSVISKLIGKDDKMASNDKTKTAEKKSGLAYAIKSIAWLVEASFRGFAGWVLLTNFDHLATTIAAFYALGTAALIVVTHFVKAHK